jgi:hypothetical protein
VDADIYGRRRTRMTGSGTCIRKGGTGLAALSRPDAFGVGFYYSHARLSA